MLVFVVVLLCCCVVYRCFLIARLLHHPAPSRSDQASLAVPILPSATSTAGSIDLALASLARPALSLVAATGVEQLLPTVEDATHARVALEAPHGGLDFTPLPIKFAELALEFFPARKHETLGGWVGLPDTKRNKNTVQNCRH